MTSIVLILNYSEWILSLFIDILNVGQNKLAKSSVKSLDLMVCYCFLGKVGNKLQKHCGNANRHEKLLTCEKRWRCCSSWTRFYVCLPGDGQVDFNEFMTILGPKLLSSETREGFLGSTIDTIFWQVKLFFFFGRDWSSRTAPLESGKKNKDLKNGYNKVTFSNNIILLLRLCRRFSGFDSSGDFLCGELPRFSDRCL